MRLLTLALSLVAGCASTTGDAALRDLQARLEASERARVEMSRKLEELDNKVFLITDQVESQKVQLARGRDAGAPIKLPVVTLSPTHREEERVEEQPPEPDLPSTIPEEDGNRPKVALQGNATPWLGGGGGDESASPAPAAQPRRARAAPKRAAQAAAAAEARASSDEQATTLYRAAYAKLKDNQPEAAAAEFRAFVQRFPNHDLADNAQYWLGETYYARAAYKDAAPEFRAVLRRWPSGNKAPDALLKLAYCLLQIGEAGEGRTTLGEVIDHYPRTEAAQLARKRLDELKAENKP